MSTIFADKFKNTSGGNNVKVNELSGIDTAGSITVQGEGTATTNLQQGLAKAWISLNGDSTSSRDSLNVGSITDNGVGDYTVVFTNNMGNANYGVSGACCADGSANSTRNILQINSSAHNAVSAPVANSFRSICIHDGNNVAQDVEYLTLTAHGDLA